MDFFQEFERLRERVPRIALINVEGKNSPDCNFVYRTLNSTYCAGSDFLDNCSYCYWCYHCRDCLECSYCYDCVECFECIDCKNCYNSSYLQDCEDLTNCSFCFDCRDLQDCFACIGIWRKQYHIFNKPYSKGAYFATIEKLKKKSPLELRKLFREVKGYRPHAFMRQLNAEGCSGDYIINSARCVSSFDVKSSRDSGYLNNAINVTDTYDLSFGGEPPVKDCYEIMSGMGLKNCLFCSTCWGGENLEYCELLFNCQDCFGCVGLQNKRFYILNRPYSEGVYHEEVRKMKRDMVRVGQYGRWFDSSYPLEDTLEHETSQFQHHEKFPEHAGEIGEGGRPAIRESAQPGV